MLETKPPGKRQVPVLRAIIAVLIVLAFVGASIARSLGYFIHDIYWIQEWLGGDTATHAVMGAAIAVAILIVTGLHRFSTVFKVLGLTLLLLTIEELLQLPFPTRRVLLSDLLAGYAGASTVCAGAMFVIWLRRKIQTGDTANTSAP